MTSFPAMIAFMLCAPVSMQDAPLTVRPYISDSMVLQQGTDNWISGTGEPGEVVWVNLQPNARVWEAVIDEDGNWSVALPVGSAKSSPTILTIETEEETIEIEDVLIGELWLCSGQSNMVWSVDGSSNPEQVKADAEIPSIRMFTVGNASQDVPQESIQGQWLVCSPETVGRFSAVGYHFGRGLHDALEVPIGLVNASWGGSRVEAWMRPEALQANGACGQSWAARWAEASKALYADPAPYAAVDVDDSSWLEGVVPGHVNAFGVEDSVDGIFWHRIPVEIPADWNGKDLVVSLGMIDDHDVTFFDGTEIGRTNGWKTERRYEIPAELVTPGSHVLAVRCLDGAGPGGLHGEPEAYFIHPVEDPGTRIPLAGPARMIVASHASDMPAQHRPSHLYNGMLHPLREIPFRGVIWYQGENNAIDEGDPDCYEGLLRDMVADWRDVFGSEDLSFQIVQLPNFEHAPSWDYARVREAQRRVAQSDPNAGLAITIDVGDARDIHPRNKHDVGDRLARLALADVYGQESIVKSGPLPESVRATGRGTLVVRFDIHGSRLGTRDGAKEVVGFEVASGDMAFAPVDATILNDRSVELVVPEGQSVAWVRYAWAGDPGGANLVNQAGLPASPFELSVGGAARANTMLVFTRTAGFRHGSIPDGIACFEKLGAELGLKVIATEDAATFNDRVLSRCALVVFLNTTGDVLDAPQEAALERYVTGGGGWLGVHSAADTEYDWPFYGELVGAYFKTHPRIQEAVVQVEDRDHPSTRMLPGLWRRTDEWYVYRLSPRPNVRVLASLDETTYSGGGMNGDHPIAWCHEVGKGRALYTGGGHTSASYVEPKFVEHLRGAILWSSGREEK